MTSPGRLRGSARVHEQEPVSPVGQDAARILSRDEAGPAFLRRDLTRLAGVCSRIAAEHPSHFQPAIIQAFEHFDMVQTAAIDVAWYGSTITATVFPLIAAEPHRREAFILITELAPLLEMLAASWDR